jgi:hypothetical protein
VYNLLIESLTNGGEVCIFGVLCILIKSILYGLGQRKVKLSLSQATGALGSRDVEDPVRKMGSWTVARFSALRRQLFGSRNIFWDSFLLEVERIPGPRCGWKDEGNRERSGDSSPRPSGLHFAALTIYGTSRCCFLNVKRKCSERVATRLAAIDADDGSFLFRLCLFRVIVQGEYHVQWNDIIFNMFLNLFPKNEQRTYVDFMFIFCKTLHADSKKPVLV